MDWSQITGFYYVAKNRSFTKAAETVYKTQSALTHQIKALEKELDCLLFERIGKRKIRLTEAGVKFFAFSEEIIKKYNLLLDDLNELKGLKKGQLKIAAPFTTLYHLLPVPLEKYIGLFPQVELTILDRSQQNVIELVKEGEVDFGLLLESMVPAELDFQRWKKVEVVLLVPKNHPLTGKKQVRIEDLAEYPLILPPKDSGLNYRKKLDELFAQQGLEYRVAMESSNVELSSLYTELGLGISFATIAQDLPIMKKKKLAFIPLKHYFNSNYILIVLRKNTILPSFKKAFINMLVSDL